ncbi:hypothetical protein F2Q70_00039604 [Brassica cretica]|uniref:Uncharacterized protein n=1 Tax=Brassica cretica TaxID=69181 RepID=A0A8S9K725_BRACR|nr:hypothetical protein F2Q70_00039604 [Brassica cretica]
MVLVAVTISSLAIVFTIYWDIFKDRGLMNRNYNNYKGGVWDDEYENDDDDYAEKWRRRGNDGNGSVTGSFGSGSERSKFWKRV